jgi:nitronate monooxygenase
VFPELARPIVQAPMGGGPSTVELAAAVSGAGGLGFLAAGYKPVEAVQEEVAALRQRVELFGLNVFVPSTAAVDEGAVQRYVAELAADAARYGVELGEPRFDDDAWEAKLELAVSERVPVVSFAFGCPPAAVIARLQAQGTSVWVTVTSVEESIAARAAGPDALVVQGTESGAHRGSFTDDDSEGLGLLALLRLAAREVDLPLVATGGIADGAGVAAVLAAGARAAQIGTAFLLCPEAGTSEPHRAALRAGGRPTAVTRAFTGRRARGIANRFLTEHSASAPSAYPQVHHATVPLRAAARQAGDAETINLWAGQAYPLAEERPAGELVRRWSEEARRALVTAQGRA